MSWIGNNMQWIQTWRHCIIIICIQHCTCTYVHIHMWNITLFIGDKVAFIGVGGKFMKGLRDPSKNKEQPPKLTGFMKHIMRKTGELLLYILQTFDHISVLSSCFIYLLMFVFIHILRMVLAFILTPPTLKRAGYLQGHQLEFPQNPSTERYWIAKWCTKSYAFVSRWT